MVRSKTSDKIAVLREDTLGEQTGDDGNPPTYNATHGRK